MIKPYTHVGEIHFILFPFYLLTNCLAAYRAYQLTEINIYMRIWMTIGLAGGGFSHANDFIAML